MVAMIKIKRTIIAKNGKRYQAILEGQKGGDLFGGKIKYNGKFRPFAEVKHLFPIKSLTETPFIDMPYVGEDSKPRKTYPTATELKIKKILGK